MTLPNRAVFGFIFIACAALVADAVWYMQEQLGLDPCPMCILQRYAFIAIGAIAFVAAIHGRAARVYGSLIVLFCIAGGGVAIRHSYVQHFPPKTLSCGSDLDFLLNALPLTKALPKIFAGTGDCSAITWTFLGLTIPEWALVWFLLFAALAIWACVRKTAARVRGPRLRA